MPSPTPVRAARTAALLSAAAVAVCSLAGCSSDSGRQADSSPTARATLTGDVLATLLPPTAYFSRLGYARDTSVTRDIGSTPVVQSVEPRVSRNCGRLDTTGWTELTGISGTSFAQSSFVSKDMTEQYAPEIDVFNGTTSSQYLGRLPAVVRACPTYTSDGVHVRVTGRAVRGLGDGAYQITLSADRWEGPVVLLSVRRATAVVSVLASRPSLALAESGARAIAARILTSVGTRAG